MLRRSRLRLFAAIAAGTVMLAVVVSCSLGLDESKIASQADAAPGDDVTQPDSSSGDAADGGPGDGATAVVACGKDEDCVAPNACAKGRCDLVAKRCVYDVCRPMACNASACDPATKACGAPVPYKFNVTKFQVGVPAQRMVAVYPWLFVQTAVGVVAFNISEPTLPTPPKVTISNLGFVPNQMVATDNRVFFMSGPNGPANIATSTVPIAYVDVPPDPFATKIEAKGTLATFSRPGSEGVVMIPRENDTVLLYSTTGGGPQPVYNATIVQPPFVEPVTFTTTPLLYQAGVAPLNVISGSRFLMQAYDGNSGVFVFGLVTAAGTTMPMNGGTYSFADAGPHGTSQTFAMGPGGSVFWSSASLTEPPSNPDPPEIVPLTRAARAQFLFANGAGDYDRPSSFDMEVYTNPPVGPGAQSVGPAALLDPDTALVLTAARENPGAQTSVQVAKRVPLGLVKDGAVARRAVLPVALGTFVAAAGANGIGYAVANESMPGPNATVYVFAPDCLP
jgi:hypothetical protein